MIMTVFRPPVKRTRKTPRRPGRFGAGVLRATPCYAETCTAADAAWAAQAFAEQREREDRAMLERAADEALTIQRMADGWRF
jgi:hypothetical protein